MMKHEDIIKPLIFLDIFDYPPTAMEIWRFLGVRAELGELVNFLSSECHPHPSLSSVKTGGWNNTGLYFLPGREELIEKRREFVYLSEKKFKIAKRAAWLLHFIPSIKMLAVCNNFYYREKSDIDFFIITAPNRLWLTRFFATIILDIFCLRARGKKTADKICLSFYLSENNLNLEGVVLRSNDSCVSGSLIEMGYSRGTPASADTPDDRIIDDPYFCYWLAFLEPIYGQECYNKFWEANAWLLNIFPNALPKMPVPRRRVDGIPSQSASRDCGETRIPDNVFSRAVRLIFIRLIGNWLEAVMKNVQWRKLLPQFKEMAALDDKRVVLNKAMLKFHENDRREYFRDEFEKKINKNK